MAGPGGTLGEQIAQWAADCKSKAEGLTPDEIRDQLKEPEHTASIKSVIDKAAGVLKSIDTARRHFLQSGGESRHQQPLMNLLRKHALLMALKTKLELSSHWRNQASYEQSQAKLQAEVQAQEEYRAVYNQNAGLNNRSGPSAARGSRGGGAGGSRGASMQLMAATIPNPSSVNNGNVHDRKERATHAARETVTNPMGRYIGSPGHGGASGSGGGLYAKDTEIITCLGCSQRKAREEVDEIDEVGLLCKTCQDGQRTAEAVRTRTHTAANNNTNWKQTDRGRKQPNPSHVGLRPVNKDSFYHQGQSNGLDNYAYNIPGKAPPLPLQKHGGGNRVLRGDHQQKQQRQNYSEDFEHFNGGHQNSQRTFQRKKTRQTSITEVPGFDTHGTDANPITLGDTDSENDGDHEDDDEDGNGNGNGGGGGGAISRALRGVKLAETTERNRKQRTTRLGSGALNPSAVRSLQGLRCLMPPEGGPGAVEFTAADLARLAPDEFLNDTAIDYYLRWLRMKLEQERPQDAERCYFFNSFFYKKLSEKNASGGGAAASYAKVKKWTRGFDIFAKDYVFVPIHDHLHWSLMIICHPGAELPEKSNNTGRKRPGSATGSGNSSGGGGVKKRSVGSDVVVIDSTEEEVQEEVVVVQAEADPRLAPTPEPFFLHLDSLAGGHSPESIAKVLRSYLRCEWEARIEDPKAPEDSVPKKWAAEARARAEAAAAEKETKKNEKEKGKITSEERTFNKIIHTKMPVPKQDNHCDCGLFVCAFVEYFTAALPKALNTTALKTLKDRFFKDGIDLWEGALHEGTEDPAWYPGFLTKHWFKHENASNLRWELLKMVLTHMAQAAGIVDSAGSLTPEQKKKSVTAEQAEALIDEVEKASKYQEGGGEYIRPDIWRLQAEEGKRGRAERRKNREEEARNRALAEKLHREEQEKRNTRASQLKKRVIDDSDSDSDYEDEEEEEGKEEKQRKLRSAGGGGGRNFSEALFDAHMKVPELPNYVQKFAKSTYVPHQHSPDDDFGIDLDGTGPVDDDIGAGGGDGADADGNALDSGCKKEEKKEREREDPEGGDIEIMPEEETTATALGRFCVAYGGDESLAAQAAAAAAAATAPSPAVVGNNAKGGSYGDDQEEYHDAEEDGGVEITYEDEDILDPQFDDGGDSEDDDAGHLGAALLRASLKDQDQTIPTSTTAHPFPKTTNRRSKTGQKKAQEEAALKSSATHTAESLVKSNKPPPQLDAATRCTISRQLERNNNHVVKSASLIIEYNGIPSFEIELHSRDAFTRITHWYQLWGKDLPQNCEHVLPPGLLKASIKSAQQVSSLLDQQKPDTTITGGGGGGGKGVAASLQTTEDGGGQDDDGDIVAGEETSPGKHIKAKAREPRQGAASGRFGNNNPRPTRGGGGGGGAARNQHIYFDDKGDPLERKEEEEADVIEINDAEEEEHHMPSPAWKKKKPGAHAFTNAPPVNGKRKNKIIDARNNGEDKTQPYEGDYALPEEDFPEDNHPGKQKKQKKQQKISSAHPAAGSKSPPVSPRGHKNKMQKGAKTQHGRNVTSISAGLHASMNSMKANNNQNNNNQRRGGGGQAKKKAVEAPAVDLTRSPSPSPSRSL